MIKYKYYIKTEDEFIKEFGNNWRDVRNGFINSMDYLLGTEIDIEIYENKIINGRLNLNNLDLRINKNWFSYTISEKMIKEVKIGIDYNQKKVLIYE